MVWTGYNYRLGPTGGTLVPLSDYADGIWIPAENVAGKRGGNITVPSRHGTRWRPYKFYEEGLVEIRMALSYTNAAGTVTHTDGAPGHIYANHAAVKALWNTGLTTATLRRDMPDAGEVDLIGEIVDDIVISDTQFIFAYIMRAHLPAWRSTTPSSSGSPVVIAGDAQVQDAVLEFSGAGTFVHTPSGATCVYSGSGGALVYPYEDRATDMGGSTDKSSEISFNRDYGVIFHPGSNAFTGPVTVHWRNQWQIG